MSRDDYVEVFQLFLDICNIEKEVVVDNTLSSVFDGQKELGIPGNDSYAIKPKQRVLKMMIHEIETHFYNEKNHNKKFAVRGGDNLFFEEGHAQGLEMLFSGKSMDEIGYTISLPRILMGEILTGDEFFDYQTLRSKGLGHKGSVQGGYNRSKRGYPDNMPGVQHKDTSYSRGIRQVKEFLHNGGDYKDLYLGKLSQEDLPYAKRKQEELGSNVEVPLLLTDLVLTKLLGGKGSAKEKGFKDHIQK